MARKLSTEKPKKVRSSNMDTGNRPLIAAGIGIAVVFLLFLIGMGILLTSFLGRFAEDDTATGQVTTITYSIKQRSDFQNGYAGRTLSGNVGSAYELYGEEGAADMEGETTLPKVTSNYGTGSEFEYGTIKGNTYKSKFSGITFDAPSGWTLRGASKSTVTPTSILDLDARNSTGTMSVKLQYFSLSGGNYKSSGDVLNALYKQVGSDVEVKATSHKIAGNNFTGFAFDGMNGQDMARSEVLVTQVNGYALVLQIVAPTQKDIDNILKNFS